MNEVILSAIMFYSLVNGINPKLTQSIMLTESSYNSKAVGSHGEVGLMQIRPHYEKYPYRSTLQDDEVNIALATKKLGSLKKRLSPKLGNAWFTAYNMGATGAIKASKRKSPTEFQYYKHVSRSYDKIFLHKEIKKYVIPYRNQQYKLAVFSKYENKKVERRPASLSMKPGYLAKKHRNFFFDRDPGAVYKICHKNSGGLGACGKGFYYEKGENAYFITNAHVCLNNSVTFRGKKYHSSSVSYMVSNSISAFSIGQSVDKLIYSTENDLCAIPTSLILKSYVKGMFPYKEAKSFNPAKKSETVKVPIYSDKELNFKFVQSRILGPDNEKDEYSRKDSYILDYHLKRGMSGLPILDTNNRVKYILWSSDYSSDDVSDSVRRTGKSYLIGGKSLQKFFSKL